MKDNTTSRHKNNNNSSMSQANKQTNPQPSKLQHRLKKEIDLKFNKKPRNDEINRSTQSVRSKNSSLLFNNPLTKSAFSLTDAITHKSSMKDALQPIKKVIKSMSSKKSIALSSRQKYSSFDENLFKTRAEGLFGERDQSKKEVDIQQQIQKKQIYQRMAIHNRNNKFKLLFKEKNSLYKSNSQRKIARIDTKINLLKQKKLYLESLIPVEKPKNILVRLPPKNYNINQQDFKEKIKRMVNQLIKTIELYFNMYLHNNIVGGHLKNVEGYNRRIKQILMIDDARAKRITKWQQLMPYFQVFKPNRGQYYMQEDMAIFNLISNFLLKMQKKYSIALESYNYFENKKRKDEKDSFRKTQQKFEKKLGSHESINKINHFIQNRLRFDQTRREQYMQNLQKRGVTLNLIERSRQLILREKEDAVKNALRLNLRK